MPYVTHILTNTYNIHNRMSRQELIDSVAQGITLSNKHSKGFFRTRTFFTNSPKEVDLSKLSILLNTQVPKEYYTFRIPKASGGTRKIEAPSEVLKQHHHNILRELNNLRILPHDAAYAYTSGRAAIDAIITHQRAGARWFLKLDIKEFFPSTTKNLMQQKLANIYPLSEREGLTERLADTATNAELQSPQGSPLSPMLTNLVLLDFDIRLTKELKRTGFTYTRYADDLLISSRYHFQFNTILALVTETFTACDLPYRINTDKIRYGSSSGRNWNLGLMYTHDNRITIGQKKKKEYHHLLCSMLTDYSYGVMWEISSVQELIGKLGYLKNIEPEYYDKMFTKYEIKFGLDISAVFKTLLR